MLLRSARGSPASLGLLAGELTPANSYRWARSKGVKPAEMTAKWDQSGDGKISLKEFRKQALSLGIQAKSAEVEEFFRKLDSDGNGVSIYTAR